MKPLYRNQKSRKALQCDVIMCAGGAGQWSETDKAENDKDGNTEITKNSLSK